MQRAIDGIEYITGLSLDLASQQQERWVHPAEKAHSSPSHFGAVHVYLGASEA